MRRRYRVHVEADHGVCHVRLVRSRFTITDYITIARFGLAVEGSEELLAEARYRAKNLADELNALERS